MNNDFLFDLEIIIKKAEEGNFFAYSPMFTDIIGRGETEKKALNELSSLIQKNISKKLKDIFNKAGLKIKSLKEQDKHLEKTSNMFLNLKIEMENYKKNHKIDDLISKKISNKKNIDNLLQSFFAEKIAMEEEMIETPYSLTEQMIMLGVPFSKN